VNTDKHVAGIERMAREAGLHRAGDLWYSLDTGSKHENADVLHEDLARFAALVRAQALEDAASWIEEQRAEIPAHGWEFAAAIRALKDAP